LRLPENAVAELPRNVVGGVDQLEAEGKGICGVKVSALPGKRGDASADAVQACKFFFNGRNLNRAHAASAELGYLCLTQFAAGFLSAPPAVEPFFIGEPYTEPGGLTLGEAKRGLVDVSPAKWPS
jgi:hypothetical protein